MKNLYCPNCGGQNSYEYKKPNFCTSCGNKFAHASLLPAPKKVEVVQNSNEEEDEEEEYEPSVNFKTSPLKFSFDIGNSEPYTIKSLSTIKDPLVDKSSNPKLSKKQIKTNLSNLQSRVREKRQVDLGD